MRFNRARVKNAICATARVAKQRLDFLGRHWHSQIQPRYALRLRRAHDTAGFDAECVNLTSLNIVVR
jgi:hypothetical protein